MVKTRIISGWSISPSILFGQSPKITYRCGDCGHINSTRISMDAIRRGKPYVVCSMCGEVNDTRLKYS